jgi:hypothetical protein
MSVDSPPQKNPALSTLRLLAYLSPLIGAGCAIAVWTDLGTRPDKYGISETSPSGIVLGIFVALGGVLICALLHVICDVAQATFEIKRTNRVIMETQIDAGADENLAAPIE